ncbi:MAG: class I SAM-dependent methyltransferase [Flavobacteriaceae bacterium]|nr:class I SAM-dependent methyltransferase [Flavobacteriaceae bacterium]
MDFIKEKIGKYTEDHTSKESDLLKELDNITWQKILQPHMISGHYQGRLLSLISKLVKPKVILEIGTYTGYSAICLAEGLVKGGVLHTIDKNEELSSIQKEYFGKSEYSESIITHTGNALDIIPNIDVKLDLVFIDADKGNYVNYYNQIIDKMNSGGVILSDNVLWYGKVIEPIDSKDIDTLAIDKFNKILASDPRVETIMLPIRDGISITRVL